MEILMPKHVPISVLAVAIVSSWLLCITVPASSQAQTSDSQRRPQNSDPSPSRQSPSQEEIRARVKKLIANQHRDDTAESQYEWIERHVDQTGGANPRTLDDKTIRMVPNGAGATKIILAENGKSTDPAESRRQLQNVVQVLQMMLNPNDPRMKTASAKYQKRMRDRAELVDSVADAFVVTWQRQEVRGGRDCDVIQINPDPNYHPHSIFQDALTHVSAIVWVDHTGDQIVHAEAKILSDIPFGAGLLGKVYRGGAVTIDQAEVAPGIWLTTHEQYDFSGRKFLFPFEAHQTIDFSQFQFVGPPKDALAMVQAELAEGKPVSGDP
jgi:hypothetical protein